MAAPTPILAILQQSVEREFHKPVAAMDPRRTLATCKSNVTGEEKVPVSFLMLETKPAAGNKLNTYCLSP
ncbi:hypothetical protein AAC387_Pa09g1102 [Persea americana]